MTQSAPEDEDRNPTIMAEVDEDRNSTIMAEVDEGEQQPSRPQSLVEPDVGSRRCGGGERIFGAVRLGKLTASRSYFRP